MALRYLFGAIRSRAKGLLLLLLVVMPLMALVSTALTAGLLGMSLGAAMLVGAAVSPTDPVLSSSVATGEDAERDLPPRDRELLSLESGANDGLAMPLVLIALAVAGAFSGTDALLESAWQLLGAQIDEVISQFAVLPFFLVLGAMLPWSDWARMG